MRRVQLGVLLLAGCLAPLPAAAQSPDADKATIRAAWEGWLKVAAAGDADAYMSFLTDDAVILDMTQGQQPIVGKAIHPWVKDFFSKFSFTWSEQSQDIVVVGDQAFRRYTGVATFAPKAGGEPGRLNRRYVDVLRRASDGRWKVAYHVFTPNQ